jgi:tRNA (guanine-N7-)-methyltransferase
MIKRETLQLGHERSIRSFAAREGRLTDAHRLALQELWPVYGLALQHTPIDLPMIFGRDAPVTLEIGFGTGTSLLQQARLYPDNNFIGIEVYRTGIAKLLYGVKESKLTNIRVFCADATEVLQYCIADNSLQQVQLFFPDPWPKARHHKRRIVQPTFINVLRQKLCHTGRLHMATDWEDYAQHMLAVMQQAEGWENEATHNFIARPKSRSLTKFELRGQSLGHKSWDLVFYKR